MDALTPLERGQWWRHRATGRLEKIKNISPEGAEVWLGVPGRLPVIRVTAAHLRQEWDHIPETGGLRNRTR